MLCELLDTREGAEVKQYVNDISACHDDLAINGFTLNYHCLKFQGFLHDKLHKLLNHTNCRPFNIYIRVFVPGLRNTLERRHRAIQQFNRANVKEHPNVT